jgi:uncharacterized membrane protein
MHKQYYYIDYFERFALDTTHCLSVGTTQDHFSTKNSRSMTFKVNFYNFLLQIMPIVDARVLMSIPTAGRAGRNSKRIQ